MSNSVETGGDGEFTTLRTVDWQRYQAYVAGIERRVHDYEEDERRREEYNRERALTTATEEKRSRKLNSAVVRVRLLYAGGWLAYIIIGGLAALFSVATLPVAIPQAMAGEFAAWLPLVVLLLVLVVPLVMSGYQRIQRPVTVFLIGLLGPLAIWGLVFVADYAGIATILPATPAAT